MLEHIPLGRQQRGPAGYREFAGMWLNAFPDATVEVERVSFRGGGRCEVDLRVSGTHRGSLDLGGYGHFKPSGAAGEMRLRQMVEIDDGRIAFSSLSFDVQDIVQQLVSVDVPALLKRLEKIRDLETRLAAVPPDDMSARRAVLDRLGDRARRGAPDRQAVLRPVGVRSRTGPRRALACRSLTADVRPRDSRAHRKSPP